MKYGFKVTTRGRAVLAACTALGVPPRFTRAAVGSGKVDEETNLADVHQLLHYEDEGAVGEWSHEGDRLYLTVQYSNKDRMAGAFLLNEFMLFAEDPVTNQETDFLYATLGDYPQGIPGRDEMLPVGVWNFPLMILISDELEVEVSASPGLVTWDDIKSVVEQIGAEEKVIKAIQAHNAADDVHPNLTARMQALETALNGSPTIIQAGNPTAQTAGKKGQHYINSATGAEFECTAVTEAGFTWQAVGVGASIRDTLGAVGDMENRLADVASRVTLMELMFSTQVKGNPFTVTFESLEGLAVAGVWNAAQSRVEF